MTAALQLSDFNSRKFRFWAFVSMFLLVFVHGYNLNERFMQPWTTPSDQLTVTSFLQYFLANGIFRFRIPMLFIISGYLFAMHDYRPYRERTRKRLKTLLLPYLIWSAMGLAFTWALEWFAYSRDIVAASGVVRIDDQRALLHDYTAGELLARWLLIPVPYQLWFIRVLLIYNLAYPAIRWCVTRKVPGIIFFSLAILMWLSTTGLVLVEGEGLLFFSLGIWMQKREWDIDRPKRWLAPAAWGTVFVLLAALKTILAFHGQAWLGEAVYPVITVMHKVVVVSGLIAAWYGCDRVVVWCMKRKWFVWLTPFAFMIYAVHAPMVAYLIEVAFRLLHDVPLYRMLNFILLPLAIIAFSVGFGALLRRVLPGVYAVLTGGRGL